MTRARQPVPQRSSLRTLFASGVAMLAMAVPAFSEGLHGRLVFTDSAAYASDLSLDASLGGQHRNALSGDLRLQWDPRWGNWDFSVHYQLSAARGSAVALARSRGLLLGGSPPPATLFALSRRIVDSGDTLVTQRLDRLAIGYSAPNFVARVGRQALTWGAGTVFHPMDLVDPFAPGTVDTEYKPGVDMIYMQWLFRDDSDLQVVVVPRALTAGGQVSASASTFALHYHRMIGDLGATWLLARDHGDLTLGMGLSGALGGAVWNAEIIPTILSGGSIKTSALANISGATTILQRNATLFAEYFHNGFGVVANGAALDTLPADLADRLARGQVFNTSRDYLAAGMTLEWTPLLTVSPSVIINLNDKSAFLVSSANWSLSDNTAFNIGALIPLGPTGTEYGGLPLSGSTAPYMAPAATIYVQLSQHF